MGRRTGNNGRNVDGIEYYEKELQNMRRGDIYYADLNPVVGCEQGGLRPVVIIQNNIGNRCSPTTIVAAMSSNNKQAELPTHVCVKVDGLSRNSIVMLEQIRTIDRKRLKTYINSLEGDVLMEIDEALSISVGLNAS